MAVFLENGGFGGTTAAPAAGLLIEHYLRGRIGPGRKRWEDWIMYGNFVQKHHGL